jgi:hypothetical protein
MGRSRRLPKHGSLYSSRDTSALKPQGLPEPDDVVDSEHQIEVPAPVREAQHSKTTGEAETAIGQRAPHLLIRLRSEAFISHAS